MPDLLFRTAARVPQAPAIDFMGRVTSYAELASQVRRTAAGFRARGIGPGSTVGLFLPNCPHYVIAAYGAWTAGARLANFSPLYTADELRVQVEDAEADLMVTLDVKALLPTIETVLQNSRLKGLVIGNVAEALPFPKSLLYRLFKGSERTPFRTDLSHIPFADLLAHTEYQPHGQPVMPEEVALLQYTGGTTGTPKGAMLTHANLSVNAQQVNAMDDQPDAPDRILAALPLFHIFAHTCIMNRTILKGAQMVLLPKFEVKAALEAIQRAKITALPGVPTMYRALLDHPDLKTYDLSSIRICISGGAPCPEPVQTAFEAATGAKLIEGYGLTESSGVVCANPYSGGKPGTIGQPLAGTLIRLLDKDDPSKMAPPGANGELAFRGPQMMKGYWKRDNADVFADGYLRTGDVAEVDEDGYYRIVDRLKDMIIVGGFKVFPSQVEDVLYTNEAISEAIVLGVPDDYLGERPKAFVTLKAGSDATAEQLLKWLNGHLGKHERVVAVEIRDSLPKTMIGKLSRKELEAEERAKAAAAA
ncbi:long-chain fatty acid--CoA ligase [Sandaracinobacter neustonicus]|uniref:Long-chain-fatty-acid--CoA ligase n=2 Tax=Sandaracinobacter neustonicus TaxID=1715348 RepID=A0A501XU90_9SPHN|nr:long-chain fatty acid--CoA ligase [Sandaracinobacter neustonicus]